MGDVDPRMGYFDGLAANWDHEGPPAERVLAHLDAHADRLGFAPGQSVLEVGCGTGRVTGWLVQRVGSGRVVAVDFAPRMIEQASAKGIPAEFRCLDACSDSFDGERFDAVFCFHVFPHFRDPLAALRNLAGAMAGDGRLVVMHMRGSAQINAFHASLSGPVRGDALPDRAGWDHLLRRAALTAVTLIDQDDLFLLVARRAGSAEA